MANKVIGKATVENSGSKSKAKSHKSALFTMITVFIVILIIVAVFGGVFYFIIHNNVNGLAERYRSSIQNIPLAKHALPKAPEKYDPLDPENLTSKEIEEKYVEFRRENEALKNQLAGLNDKLTEYMGYKDEYDALLRKSEEELLKSKEREAALDKRELELDALKKELDELIATGNQEAFSAYFEKLDPENAASIYVEVVKEQQVNANVKKFAQIYAAMDESAAAQIFEELGNSQMEMTAETLKAMSKENSSAILESMTPAFAAKVTEKLNELYREN